ncbi:MAG: hypothetical protein M1834_002713 [Cirrosporium novae-zelandiae]|nr:MAG: hypothetical protein M1834_002713 [Cirrosporium novae-zelandiae]
MEHPQHAPQPQQYCRDPYHVENEHNNREYGTLREQSGDALMHNKEVNIHLLNSPLLSAGKYPRRATTKFRLQKLISFLLLSSLLAASIIMLYGRINQTLTALATYLGIGALFGSGASGAGAQFTPILPPSYPLAVRSPYLSVKAWVPGNKAGAFPEAQAEFWNGRPLGWTVIARVKDTAYSLFGKPGVGETATLNSAEYTSTHSIFILSAGSATFTLDFFSPVSPHNLVRQSLPFSYLTVCVNYQGSGNVQIYSDIDGSWAGPTASHYYYFQAPKNTSYYEVAPRNKRFWEEGDEMSLWGQAVYGTRPYDGSEVTSQVGSGSMVRDQFAKYGELKGTHADWDDGNSVLGFSHNLGNIKDQKSVTFAVGHERNYSINYLGEPQTGYYRATYPDVPSSLAHFLDDYDDAYTEAVEFDNAVDTKASQISEHYSNIVTLSVRQSFGSMEFTIPENTHNTKDAMAFMKEISSDGNVNTLDVIFPTFPIFYVTNPDIIRLLLEPVLRYLKLGKWPHEWAIHDIGFNYPKAFGHDLGHAEQMPLEESGNIILLAYAYQKTTGDSSWAKQYKDIFKGYATYLAEKGWHPANQLASSDAAGWAVNQTNLAIKSAVGMVAYGKMFSDSYFVDNGTALAHALYNEGLGTDAKKTHFVLSYNEDKTWSGCYNLISDVLFSFNIFPSEAYSMQSSWLETVRDTAGVPLDSRVKWTKSDWNMFLASISGTKVRNQYIEDLYNYVSNGKNDHPFSDRYWVANNDAGYFFQIMNRPTVGGHFAPMAVLQGSSLF